MSDTYKIKTKMKVKRKQNDLRKKERRLYQKLLRDGFSRDEASFLSDRFYHKDCPYRNCKPEDYKHIFLQYSKNPSWWNRLFTTKRQRPNDRDLCKKVTIDCDDDSDMDFWPARKPNDYYW